ncbi:MAG: hypothetical protein M3N24_11450 [Actinomycetota bacterium]|nr:hypothetical protein [Actinomycetota bacterium]
MRKDHGDDPFAGVVGSTSIGERPQPCQKCGESFDRLLDPRGRWFVCARCGSQTTVIAEPTGATEESGSTDH